MSNYQQYNKVYFKEDSLTKLKEGLKLAHDAVACTLGPRGRNVTIHHYNHNQYEQKYAIQNTKDGVTVIKALHTTSPELNVGIDLLKQACDKTVKEVGDAPQPLYSKVLTPNGWVTMGSLKVGDEICGTNGTFQKVLGVFPQGEKEIYELIFSNGQRVECSEDHLWSIVHDRKKKVYTTKEIIDKKIKRKKSNGNVDHLNYIPTTVVNFKETEELPIDPLLVGLLIGDGSLCESGSIELSLAIGQEKILEEVVLPEGITYNVKIDNVKHYARVKFKKILYRDTNMHKYIDKIGLLNKKSADKFIPKEYLYSDIKNRERLLKGLTLSDGHINKKGLLEYSTISEQLALDVVELMRGLGKQINFLKRNKVGGFSTKPGSIYRISELQGYKNGIKLIDIVKTGRFTEMQCIKVSNDDSLYITNDYVVTHNTTSTVVLAYNLFNDVYNVLQTNQNVNIYKLKEGIEKCLAEVISMLNEYRMQVLDKLELRKIAMVASNNDDQVSKLIADILWKYGQDCNITIKKSIFNEMYVEENEGIIIERGYLTPALLDKNSDKYKELRNCLIFLTDEEITQFSQIKDILNYAIAGEQSLLIVAKDYKGDVIPSLMLNRERGNLANVMLIKSPDFDYRSYEKLKDISIALNCKVISKYEGNSIVSLNKELNTITPNLNQSQKLKKLLGYSDKVVVNIEKTIIQLSKDNEETKLNDRIIERINELESEIIKENEMFTADKDWVIAGIKKRIANLKGAITTIYVNGNSELEINERIDRIDDCINSVKCALEEGYVIGGGSIFVYINQQLKETAFHDIEINTGYHLMLKNLLSPLRTIYNNIFINNTEDYNFDKVLYEITRQNDGKYPVMGYNALTEKVENLHEEGIIDSVKVIKTSLINATSLVATLITTNCLIVNNFKPSDC